MLGTRSGVIVLIMKDDNYPLFLPIHCVIHREHLAAKYFDHVMKIVLEIVNFNRSSANTHCLFINFVDKLDEDIIPNDVNYFCIVRWLSTNNVLKRFVDLFEPICVFLEDKRKICEQPGDVEWKQGLMFFNDVKNHLQAPNLSLQGKSRLCVIVSRMEGQDCV